MAVKRIQFDIARTSTPATQERPLNRRRALQTLGTLAAAAGAVTLAALRPEQAQAATASYTDSTSAAVLTADNTGAGSGVAGYTAGTGTPSAGVYGAHSGQNGKGVWGECSTDYNSYGVYGKSTPGYGVVGSGGTAGVAGIGPGIGVLGQAATSSPAVQGSNSSDGPGVRGDSIGGIGVYGSSTSSSSNSPGVWGQNNAGGPAIVGFSPSGPGFTAVTVSGVGCFGGASGSGTGVYAYSGTSTALVAVAPGAGALAGYFSGPIYVTGSLTVLGAKSAAVKAADGSLRRMYSLESPESWFEDFGTGQLSGGTATVQLEPGFAALVHSDGYHVFPVPEGDCKGLYASQKTANSFTVRECQGGTSNVPFDYRIVAKRKDISGARLEHVDEPPTPEVPAFPTPPTPPPTPAIPPGHGLEH